MMAEGLLSQNPVSSEPRLCGHVRGLAAINLARSCFRVRVVQSFKASGTQPLGACSALKRRFLILPAAGVVEFVLFFVSGVSWVD